MDTAVIGECLFNMVSGGKGGDVSPATRGENANFHGFFLSRLTAGDGRGSQRQKAGREAESLLCWQQAMALVKNRSLDSKQLARASRQEIAEVSAWLLAGANGLAPVNHMPEAPGNAPAAIDPIQAESEAAHAPVAETGDMSSLVADMEEAAVDPRQGDAFIISDGKISASDIATTLSPLAALVGLAALPAAEMAALARCLFIDLAAASGSWQLPLELPGPLSFPGDTPDFVVSLHDTLARMNGEEIVSLFARAADLAGCDIGDLSAHKLPVVVLRSLAIEMVEIAITADVSSAPTLLAALAFDGQRIRAIASEKISSPLESPAGETLIDSATIAGGEAEENAAAPASSPETFAAEAKTEKTHAEHPDKISVQPAAMPGQKDKPYGGMSDPSAEQATALSDSQPQDSANTIPAADSSQPETAEALADISPLVRKRAPRATETEPGAELPTVVNRHEPSAAVGQRPATDERISAPRLAENIERIEQAVRFAVRRGLAQVSVDLLPPELGRLHVRIEMRQGVVSALIQAEKAEARQLLLSGVEQLRQNLQVHGVDLDFFDVHLGNPGNGSGNGDWPARPALASPSAKPTSGDKEAGEPQGIMPMAMPATANFVNVVA